MQNDLDHRPPEQSPYKLLGFYDTSDADDFFGRDAEIRAVGQMVRDHRLCLLYGASGAGKTSLLLAGVLPVLNQHDSPFLAVYIRLLGEPEVDLRREVGRAARERLPVLKSAGLAGSTALSHVKDLIVQHFSLQEIGELCLGLVRYEDVLRSGITETAVQLVESCRRLNRLPELLRRCRQMRSSTDWLGELTPERLTLLVSYEQAQTEGVIPFLSAAAALLDVTLVLIVDQFEAFFLRGEQVRRPFVDLLASLHDAEAVPVHLLLSLREDWLAHVDEIEARVPTLASRERRKRLLPLARPNARAAIADPLRNTPYRFQDGLVERLLDDLIDPEETGVMPVQLQIVCSALFEQMRAAGHREMRLADYQELGETAGILSHHFSRVLDAFPPEQAALAGVVLEELVSSRGTRVARSLDELVAALAFDAGALRSVLERLLLARMLRVVSQGESLPIRYELVHDYLIRDIHLGQAARERKQMEEMVRKELEDWQSQRTLISAEKMRLINRQRDGLRLPPGADELLFRSALDTGEDPGYWHGRLADDAARGAILLATAGAEDGAKRQRAAVGLTKAALRSEDAAPLVSALVQIALADAQEDNRRVAAAGLEKLARHGRQTAVAAALNAAAPAGNASIKGRNRFVDLLGQVRLPLALWPAAVRRPLLTPWLLRWTWTSLWTGLIGLITAVFVMRGVEWLLTSVLKAPTLADSSIFAYVAIGFMGLLAGMMIAATQWHFLHTVLPAPVRWWRETSTAAWLLGAMLANALLTEVRWPPAWAEQPYGGALPTLIAALALLLLVATIQWLVLRANGYRLSPLPLWGWCAALMFPLVGAAGMLITLTDRPALVVSLVLFGTFYFLALPSLAVGLWLARLTRREAAWRLAAADAFDVI